MFAKATVRNLQKENLEAAVAIYRDAFRTFLNVPDKALGDADMVGPRFRAHPDGSFEAQLNNELVGTNFAARWGSVAIYGPVTTRPKGWTGNAGALLMEAALATAATWGATLETCFTFAQSADHVRFFQKLGFWPRFLTVVMALPMRKKERPWRPSWLLDRDQPADQKRLLEGARALTHGIYEGLDVTREIEAVREGGYGDTVYLTQGSAVTGFAVCHVGPKSEAGTNTCYVKFGGVANGDGEHFGELLDAVEAYAATKSCAILNVPVNTARREAYDALLGRNFLNAIQGVAMQRNDAPGYARPGVFALDDWR